ncbi:hypothetical protein [Falsiroseomonas oryzae]|uniref:hypothetical protein n=1 Tax=Falsiroseomonas oryzae TaxID=2766473 RepID=UPI0022EA38AD|nr:hypothetical protein [Roseomonas sp. MO-31]
MPRLAAVAAVLGFILAAPAMAQTVTPQPAGPPQSTPAPAVLRGAQTDRCAEPRAWLAAEETTPGILQRLAREALAACEAAPPTQPATGR